MCSTSIYTSICILNLRSIYHKFVIMQFKRSSKWMVPIFCLPSSVSLQGDSFWMVPKANIFCSWHSLMFVLNFFNYTHTIERGKNTVFFNSTDKFDKQNSTPLSPFPSHCFALHTYICTFNTQSKFSLRTTSKVFKKFCNVVYVNMSAFVM